MRLNYIDTLKGLGIILVLIGHNYNLSHDELAYKWIYGFHMPLFFFLSGFLAKERPFRLEMKKCMEHLLIPFIFFALVFTVYQCIYFCILEDTFVGAIKRLAISFNPLDKACYIYSAIWFLVCLLEVKALFNITTLLVRKLSVRIEYAQLVIGGGIFLVGYCLSATRISLPFYIDSACSAYIFFVMGFVTHRLGITNYLKQHEHYIVIALLSVVLYSFIIIECSKDVSLSRNVFPIYLPVVSMLIVIALLMAATSMEDDSLIGKSLQRVGHYSLGILGFHIPLFSFFFIIVRKAGISINLQYIIVFIFSLSLSLLLTKMTFKFAPALLGKTSHK